MSKSRPPRFRLVVCVRNDDYPASLELRKIYCCIADPVAATDGLLRVVDESGEDYLYPTECFAAIALPTSVRRALRIASAEGSARQLRRCAPRRT